MKLLIISSAPLINKDQSLFAYSPYIDEIEIWNKNVDQILFCCPIWEHENNLLVKKVPFNINRIFVLKEFNFKTIGSILKAFPFIIYNLFVLFYAIYKSDCIHIRCPGNIGLLGCLVQLFFPFKKKTAKYAGNWDPNSQQPLSYKIQKFILSSSFLTKNMNVLVYGDWKNNSINIKSFFTATYNESDKLPNKIRTFQSTIRFIFVGMLSKGKQPLYAIMLIEKLLQSNKNVVLDIYGDGEERAHLDTYIKQNKLSNSVFIHGNKDKKTLMDIYRNSHFLVLPSKSEGWPKAAAEAMFWGCFPIVTKISCVPYMLDNENQGAFLTMDLNKDIDTIIGVLGDEKAYLEKTQRAFNWSRKYTIELFEKEIKLLLKK